MKSTALLLAACVLASAACLAQNEPPKPTAEHKKLDAFVGSWTVEGDVKPNPMGPGGKMTENEKCDWMEGSFFLVCRVDFKSASMGSGSGISILGYSPEDKIYTYREYNSWGESMESKGSVEGDTWVWTSDEKMGNTVTKGRFTMKFTSPAAYTFTYEMSSDGAKWSDIMDGKASRN